MKKSFISILICSTIVSCAPFFISAQNHNTLDSLYGESILQSDLINLKKVLFESHPHPGGYADSIQLKSAIDEAMKKVSGGMTLREFIPVVQSILQVQRDSHTTIDMAGMRDYGLKHKENVIPIQFGYNGQELWVKKDMMMIIPVATRIISINGISVEELMHRTYPFSFTEGYAEVSRRYVQTAILSSVMMIQKTILDENTVVCTFPGSDKDTTIQYNGVTKKLLDERYKLKKKSRKDKFAELFSVEWYPEESLAVLKVGTFVPSYFQASEKFFKRTFRKLKEQGYQNLAIDVRDNTGGSSARVENLCSYLFEKGHNSPSNIIVRQSELAQKRSRQTLGFLKKWIFRMSKDENAIAFLAAEKLPLGATDTIYFSEPVIQKEKYIFNGKCFVFINGLTASAGVDFASAMRARARGTIIGEPCMGSGHGTWGNATYYELPETKIPLHIATIRYNSDNTFDMSPAPMLPDHLVSETPPLNSEIHDDCLEFVRNLLRR